MIVDLIVLVINSTILLYCIGNDWSTRIIPLNKYQKELQILEEIDHLAHINQEKEKELQEERREIDRLTHVLQERERELQEERREKKQLQQALQQGQERERQASVREQDLLQQKLCTST